MDTEALGSSIGSSTSGSELHRRHSPATCNSGELRTRYRSATKSVSCVTRVLLKNSRDVATREDSSGPLNIDVRHVASAAKKRPRLPSVSFPNEGARVTASCTDATMSLRDLLETRALSADGSCGGLDQRSRGCVQAPNGSSRHRSSMAVWRWHN